MAMLEVIGRDDVRDDDILPEPFREALALAFAESVRYKIVRAVSLDELEGKVNGYVQGGWRPKGGPRMSYVPDPGGGLPRWSFVFYQAVWIP